MTSENHSQNNNNTNNTQVVAKRVSATPSSLQACGERLRNGELVSFPTETVYGLGCHALDPDAVHKVFAAKRRPLTDPLIVHVVSPADACQLWKVKTTIHDESNNNGSPMMQKQALMALMDEFWPGPLTIIAQAHECVPPIVTAGTGFVAARCPSHPIARALIETAGIPIAAPSANRFGHVSPTRADHVLSDLGGEDVWVVDVDVDVTGDTPAAADDDDHANTNTNTICNVGVESTVAKVDDVEGTVSVLRHGAVSPVAIQNCLRYAGLADQFRVQICIRTTGEEVANVAPGQTIKHYSPDVPSFIISQKRFTKLLLLNDDEKEFVRKAVVLDFGGQLSWLQKDCLAYRDLSVTGDSSEAAMRVFDSLRWSELIEGAERVYFPELVVEGESDALALAVKDRLTRAASGVIIEKFQ
eukprot:CAMPEP_0196816596 /NCGR_PEP_ID=MMETSP1362-20130617/56216_1 /TAXON_ID=163516 /ORGANISM="Leptocylindrus danicus, Strain CCMP1856" /LENGTH=414 /DNA_ID=CAMNT_0042193997 /DNA_START=394 /DNA_END=1638 /DNA_ORIENTATION=-